MAGLGTSTSESLETAKQSASQVGTTTTNRRARDRGYGALAERLVRAIVEELAEIKDTMPSVADGGTSRMQVEDTRSRMLLEEILVELKKVTAHLSLVTNEEIA